MLEHRPHVASKGGYPERQRTNECDALHAVIDARHDSGLFFSRRVIRNSKKQIRPEATATISMSRARASLGAAQVSQMIWGAKHDVFWGETLIASSSFVGRTPASISGTSQCTTLPSGCFRSKI